mgnify:FL=1|tara:strand:- start:73006 stop:75159 length:2154 start_codon:yes stop_codon:yes gene_type:complete
MFRISSSLIVCAGLAVSSSLATAGDIANTTNTVMKPQTSASAAERRQIIRDNQGELSHSVARQWNEVFLDSIRKDFARPTVHARNLYHISSAMWDAWAAYDAQADQVLHHEKLPSSDVQADREEAISFASYRVLRHRFAGSPGAIFVLPEYDALMDELGYDHTYEGVVGDDAASLGNRIAATIIAAGLVDGSNEQDDYENLYYETINPPLLPDYPGNPDLLDPNRWQPLALQFFVDQSGNPIPFGYPDFLSPEWGDVTPFSLNENDLNVLQRDGNDWSVWHDPGTPPYHGTPEGDDRYKWGNEMVVVWSSHLDPTDGVMIDVSPGAIGNADLALVSQEEQYYNFLEGGDWGTGYDVNPVTGEAYDSQIVPRGDYGRILAEFWADGPDSETPPGHWFTLLNYVSDHPLTEKRFMGEGEILDDLEWDVKSYLMMGGGMHDIAIASWSVKGYYDYLRPVSAIRFLSDQGQCSDPELPSYNIDGINLIEGAIELVTAESTAVGERHEHLAGSEGKIAVKAWRGPEFIEDEDTDVAGVGWILADNWWPYQRPSFVTPPFAGYVSGHSTYSRGAAEMMTMLTGSRYFPGGIGEFVAPMNEFLVFEDGPSMDIVLQWATYQDASDQCSLSRIWGGIHPPADDLPGRHMGQAIGPEAFTEARRYFGGLKSCPADFQGDGVVNFFDVSKFIQAYVSGDQLADVSSNNEVDIKDVLSFLMFYSHGCP